MSLGDYLRYLRALAGGPSTRDVAEAAGLPSNGTITQIEQRFREIGEDEDLEKLAAYYEVPVEELRWRRAWYRKRLSLFLEEAVAKRRPVCLFLRLGQRMEGYVIDWDMGSLGLSLSDGSGEVLVQRHAVDRWEFAE